MIAIRRSTSAHAKLIAKLSPAQSILQQRWFFQRAACFLQDQSSSPFASERAEASPAVAEMLSPAVVETMLDEALRKNDRQTVEIMVEQALLFGRGGHRLVEKAVRSHCNNKEFGSAVRLLQKCSQHKLVLSQAVCNELALGAVSFLRWDEAWRATMYMVSHGMKFSERIVLFTVAGLMNQPEGIGKVLDLIEIIIRKRREDLGGMFDFSKINHLATSMNKNRNFKRYQLEASLKKVMDAWLHESSDGFRSFPLAKMIIAIASAGRMDNIAAGFISDSLKIIAENEQNVFDLDDCDSLSLIRAFSHGDGLVLNWLRSDSRRDLSKEASPIAFTLLYACLAHSKAAADGSLGVLKCLDFYTTYWVLAFRLRGAARLLPEGSRLFSLESLTKTDSSIRNLYDALAVFKRDDHKISIEICCGSSSERRALRLLCDQMGLKHKIVGNDSATERRLHVSKQNRDYLIESPSLDDILQQDALRPAFEMQFDGQPLGWNEISGMLGNMDETLLSIVGEKLSTSMKRSFPSATWLLEFSQIFLDRSIPLPRGFLFNAVKACSWRGDLYGLIEVLQLAHMEKERSLSNEFQNIHQMIRSKGYSEANLNDLADDDMESSISKEAFFDRLSVHDWNFACEVAYVNRSKVRSYRSFQEIFMEVMSSRKKYGIEIDSIGSALLLKFLAQSLMNPDLLRGLLGKIHRQMSSDHANSKTRLTHVECLAMARLLLHYSRSKFLQCSIPLFRSEHYLQLYPSSVEKIADNFVDNWFTSESEWKQFERCWSQQFTSQGRAQLFDYVRNVVLDSLNSNLDEDIVEQNKNGSDEEDDEDEKSQTVSRAQALVDITLVTSYLVATHDKKYDAAFDLMYLVMTWLHRTNRLLKKESNHS